MSYNRNSTTPEFVFVDVNKNALRFSENNIITGINVIDGMIDGSGYKKFKIKINTPNANNMTNGLG